MRTYDQYVRKEWSLFADDPARFRSALEAVEGIEVLNVLDVGCGSGQELLPFVKNRNAFGVGIDPAPEVGRAGRELFACADPRSRVSFVRGRAEALPFKSDSFEVVVCRLALPYTNNVRAIAEIARVLRIEGKLFLKIHHLRYYLRDLHKSISSLNFPLLVHTTTVLLAGFFYHVTGYQPRTFPSSETFQTLSQLQKELSKAGLHVVNEMKDSNPLTPSLLIAREARRAQLDKTSLNFIFD